MSKFYDALETRSSAEREAAHMAALPQQVAHAQKASSAFASRRRPAANRMRSTALCVMTA